MFARLILFVVPGAMLLAGPTAWAEDWPMWGRNQTRNMVSPEKNPPTDWQVEIKDEKGKLVKQARNIKWSAQLGSRSMGTPVIAGGLVFVGTNNEQPRDPKQTKDASVLMCFRESDGKFLWQYLSPRLSEGRPQDTWGGSMGSSPVVVGNRLWLITNRCEVICFDIELLQKGHGEPKLVWKTDLRKEFGVFPHYPGMAAGFGPSLPAPHKNLLYAVTGNGVDESGTSVPAPKAPSLICLNKDTGKALWQDKSPGKDIMCIQLTSPLLLEVKGRAQVVMGQGDGWLRSFDAETGKLLWKCDLNAKDSKYEPGRGNRNYIVATPVYHEGRIYIATGQNPEDFAGIGCLHCIDPGNEGDISVDLLEDSKIKPNPNSGVVWHTARQPYPKEQAEKEKREYAFGRTMSTCAVQDGLVYAPEIDGYMNCFDARTGKAYWIHDLKAAVWGSPLWVDGKIYLPTEDGDVWIFTHGKEKKAPKKIEMEISIHSSPIFANGVLYLASDSRLYAIQEKK